MGLAACPCPDVPDCCRQRTARIGSNRARKEVTPLSIDTLRLRGVRRRLRRDVVHDAIELWEPRDHMRCAAYHPALHPCMIGDRARPRIARRQDCDREQVRRYQRRARQLTVGWRASVNRSCQLAQVAAVPLRRLDVLQPATCAVATACSRQPAAPRHLVMQLCSRYTLMMGCLLSIHAALHGYLKHSIQFSWQAKRLIAR